MSEGVGPTGPTRGLLEPGLVVAPTSPVAKGSPRVSRGACPPTNEGLVEARTRGGTPGPGTYRRGSTPVERPFLWVLSIALQ